MQKPFVKVAYLGLIVIFFMLVLQLTFYLIAGEINSAILLFEFAKIPADVLNIFYEGGFDHRLIKAVNAANAVDFLFFSAYSVFLLSLLYKMYKQTAQSVYYYALLLPVIIFAADFLENIQMYIIADSLIDGGFENNLTFLQIFTYTKWLGIAAVILAVAWFAFQTKRLSGYILSVLLVFPFVFGLAALISANINLEMLFANSIVLSFGIIIAYSFLYEETA
jgi:hypothetical protein